MQIFFLSVLLSFFCVFVLLIIVSAWRDTLCMGGGGRIYFRHMWEGGSNFSFHKKKNKKKNASASGGGGGGWGGGEGETTPLQTPAPLIITFPVS